jgi:hypothetical protein
VRAWLLGLLTVLSACGGPFTPAQAVQQPFSVRIEGEDPKNTVVPIARADDCSVCSGGRVVVDIGWSGVLHVPVSVPAAGQYAVRMHYSLGFNEERRGFIRVAPH